MLMTELHNAEAHGEHPDPTKAYLVVFGSLSVFTAVSFVVYELLPKHISFIIILAVAVIKATLVGMYFMHLKWDWAKLYFLIIPAFILGIMMMFVFLPDGVLAWR
jgi:cytochrome c oxidase subunit IV